jgi:aspartate-semialdehyde dehydrogenase
LGYRVVVVGATGNVGREMLNILAEREFPADEIAAVASSRSTGTEIEFGETGKTLKVQNIEHFDFAAGISRCSPPVPARPRNMRPRPRQRAAS